ncbi:hypothetical protein IC575_014492 [Cucumis melo]
MVFLSRISNTSQCQISYCVLLMVSVPAIINVPFLENVNKFQNPFRRPVATTVF